MKKLLVVLAVAAAILGGAMIGVGLSDDSAHDDRHGY